MRILVIGGTGFIGAPVVDELVHLGHELILFHRGEHKPPAGIARAIHGDRRRLGVFSDELRKIRPHVVLDTILANERQAIDLVRTFHGATSRIVALSSADVYRACGILHGTEPGAPDNALITEESPLRTRLYPYPAEVVRALGEHFAWLEQDYDKIPMEQTVMAETGMRGTILRLPMVYGPGDPLHRFFPILYRITDGRKMMMLPETIARWRAPRGYVGNVARAIALAVADDRAAGRIYNVAEPDNFSEFDWTRLIAAAAGWHGDIAVIPDDRAPQHLKLPGDYSQHWAVDSTRIRRELGYEEPYSLPQALRSTIEWERANPPAHIDAAQFDYAAEDAALAWMAAAS